MKLTALAAAIALTLSGGLIAGCDQDGSKSSSGGSSASGSSSPSGSSGTSGSSGSSGASSSLRQRAEEAA